MIRTLNTLLCLTFLAGAAFAHQGATGVVKVRMDGMGVLQEALKTVGQMARGQKAFDLDEARAAFSAMAEEGRLVPAKFEERDLSKPTEALPAIWENWDDFVAKSEASVAAAEAAQTISDLDDLGTALRQVGQACAACHEIYRVKD